MSFTLSYNTNLCQESTPDSQHARELHYLVSFSLECICLVSSANSVRVPALVHCVFRILTLT
jgi:hypothetical protein